MCNKKEVMPPDHHDGPKSVAQPPQEDEPNEMGQGDFLSHDKPPVVALQECTCIYLHPANPYCPKHGYSAPQDEWVEDRIEQLETKCENMLSDYTTLRARVRRLEAALESIVKRENDSPGGHGYQMAKLARAALHGADNEQKDAIYAQGMNAHVREIEALRSRVKRLTDTGTLVLAMLQSRLDPPAFEAIEACQEFYAALQGESDANQKGTE